MILRPRFTEQAPQKLLEGYGEYGEPGFCQLPACQRLLDSWQISKKIARYRADAPSYCELRVISPARFDNATLSHSLMALAWSQGADAEKFLKYCVSHGGGQGPDEDDLFAAAAFIGRKSMYRFWVAQRCYSRVELDGELPTGRRGGIYSIMWGFAPQLPGHEPDLIESYAVDLLQLLACPAVSCAAAGAGSFIISTADGRHKTWLRSSGTGLHPYRREWRSVEGELTLLAKAGPTSSHESYVPHDSSEWSVVSFDEMGDSAARGRNERICVLRSKPSVAAAHEMDLPDMLCVPGMLRYDPLTNSIVQVAPGDQSLI